MYIPIGNMNSLATLTNYQLVCGIVKLFNSAYRLGVNDAYKAYDAGLCEEHIAKTSQTGVFGRVGDEIGSDAIYWQIQLSELARQEGCYRHITKLFIRMGRYTSNYLSVILPVAQDFYNMGLKDYNESPNACEIQAFNANKRLRWTARGLRFISISDIIDKAQMACFVRKHTDEVTGGKLALSAQRYLTFMRCIGLALAPRCMSQKKQ
jgi:hypothetical protein